MLVAAFLFSIMGVCVKLATEIYSTPEIVMYRSVLGLVFTFAICSYHGGTVKTTLPWHHILRGSLGAISMLLWFLSIGLLPLATAVTLNSTSSIWIAAFLFAWGLWQGKSRLEWGLVAAILLSFAGVIALLRPSVHSDQWLGGVVALISSVLSALAYLQVRNLGRMGEPDYRVVFYFSVMGFLVGISGTVLSKGAIGAEEAIFRAHSLKGVALLLAMGLSATGAQVLMTRSYRLGKTLVTANLQYTLIIFSSIWGIFIWDDILNWIGWSGIAVILISGIAATYYNTRKLKVEGGKASGGSIPSDPISTEM
jgi:S-adenosylmethionine uptake transporter